MLLRGKEERHFPGLKWGLLSREIEKKEMPCKEWGGGVLLGWVHILSQPHKKEGGRKGGKIFWTIPGMYNKVRTGLSSKQN